MGPTTSCKALVSRGLGKGVEECLNRMTPLRKSAKSLAADRPKAHEHYASMEVQKVFPEPHEILLVDDIVTRGATAIGAANKLAEAFPRARIRLFAAMRTISPPDTFTDTMAPCIGTIEIRGVDAFRRP
jgi:predicted amidophosphoribosyltransferase